MPGVRIRAELSLVGIALIWGATFVVVKDALTEVSTFLFLALRFSLATVALALVLRGSYSDSGNRTLRWRGGILTGLFLIAGYAFQTAGLRHTTASKSAFLTSLYIVLVPLLAALVYRKAPGPRDWLGIAAATLGTAFMTLDAASWRVNRGDLLTLCCTLAFAAHIVALGHYSRQIGFAWLSLLQVAIAAVVMLASFWWVETSYIRWTPRVAAALAITGLLATALAFSVQSWAQQYTTATRAALLFALEPVFAWGTSWLVLGEALTLRVASGAGLILAGILLVEVKPAVPAKHPLEQGGLESL